MDIQQQVRQEEPREARANDHHVIVVESSIWMQHSGTAAIYEYQTQPYRRA